MTPRRANELIPNVEQLNPHLDPDDVREAIIDHWRQVEKQLDEGDRAYVYVNHLGTFKAIPSKVRKKIDQITLGNKRVKRDVISEAREERKERLIRLLKDVVKNNEMKARISRERKRRLYGELDTDMEEPLEDC